MDVAIDESWVGIQEVLESLAEVTGILVVLHQVGLQTCFEQEAVGLIQFLNMFNGEDNLFDLVLLLLCEFHSLAGLLYLNLLVGYVSHACEKEELVQEEIHLAALVVGQSLLLGVVLLGDFPELEGLKWHFQDLVGLTDVEVYLC